MRATAAIKAYAVLQNLERILAIELFTAAQALEFRRPLTSSHYLEDFMARYRQTVDFVEHDRILYPDINKSVAFLREVELKPIG
jgi:histidine ammonia-lyase